MFCRNCGNQLEEDAIFCTNCGNRIDNTFDIVIDEKNSNNQIEEVINEEDVQGKEKDVVDKITQESKDSATLIKRKLIENGLDAYLQLFEDQHLFNLDVLSMMDNDDYLQIGVSIICDRKKMLLLFNQEVNKKYVNTNDLNFNDNIIDSKTEKNAIDSLMKDPQIKSEAELLYKMYGERAYKSFLEKKAREQNLKLTEEYIEIEKNGKLYCYKPSDPKRMLCRKCHAEVPDESYLCWNCNNNLVKK